MNSIRPETSPQEAPVKPRLMAISGSARGTVSTLINGGISIGRADSNQLRLHDTAVSRPHCTIQQIESVFELTDLDSHNGTFVNGIPVRRKSIEHGDTIRMGASELLFLVV